MRLLFSGKLFWCLRAGRRLVSGWLVLALILVTELLPTTAFSGSSLTEPRQVWDTLISNSHVTYYTASGRKISDFESSQDPTNGGTGVTPTEIDIASGSPNPLSPGAEASVWFGYWDGGTPWNPNDPSTMNDDWLFFRIRVGSSPGSGASFNQDHFNILLDVDGDGYKEYWLDLDAKYSGSGADRLFLFYQNGNTQNITVDERSTNLVNEWVARPDETEAYSHTRAKDLDPTDNPDKSQYFVDYQIPLTALKDLFGNQTVYPDTPIRLAYSTSASNTDPLQKDWMGYTPFGDLITFGTPSIRFTDETLVPDTQYYYVDGYVYVVATARNANTNPNEFETITVTVTDPTTGDTETLTLRETGADSGIFSNQGAADDPVFRVGGNPHTPVHAWTPVVTTYSTVDAAQWRATYAGNHQWTVAEYIDGGWQPRGTATSALVTQPVDIPPLFTSSDGDVSFRIFENDNPDDPDVGDTITFNTYAADPLPTSASAGGGTDDGTLKVVAGDWIRTRYTVSSVNYDDWAQILGPGTPIIRFTRADGTDATNYTLTTGTPASDPIYVTVNHAAANTDPNTVQTIYVRVTGTRGDLEGNLTTTIALTETGPNTGVFRNTSALPTYASTSHTSNNGTFEEYVGGIATATYTYAGGTVTDAADILVPNAGTVEFTNGTGLQDVTFYADNDYVWLKVTDSNLGTAGVRDTVNVTVTSPTGDSEVVTLYETGTDTHVFMNTHNDLATTAGSAVVTSASANFVTDGVLPGDKFVILSGPDIGTYTVGSVDPGGHQITLSSLPLGLTATRSGIIFETRPLLQAKLYVSPAGPNDGILEANNRDILTVTYHDTDPLGDLTDTATFGASPTAATISGFGASIEGGRVVVTWETDGELGTAGFYLLRLNEASGKLEKVNQTLLPGLLTAPQGGTYRLVDPSAKAGKTYSYQLIEVEARGSERTYGPFRVTVQEQRGAGGALASDLGPLGYSRRARGAAGAEPPGLFAQALGKLKALGEKKAKSAAKAAAAAQALPAVPGAQPAIKIAVKEAGLYCVGASEIAPLLGIPKAAIGTAIRKGRLSLSCQGKPVPYLPAPGDTGILFYGQPIKSIYTDENVYWLRSDRGLLMARGAGCGAQAGQVAGTFADTVHAEANQYALTAIFTDPEADFWLWDYMYVAPGDTSYAKKEFPLTVPDPATAGTATLVVRLKGATATEADPDHHAVVAINGTAIGEGRWDGTQAFTLTLPFSQQLVRAGANTVTVEGLADTGAAYSVFYVDSFDLTYQRRYLAVNGSLLCRAGDRDVVTVERFAQPAISVFDVSDPWNPALLEGATVEEANGAFLVSVPATPGGAYYALTPDAVKSPVSVEADVPSRLAWKGNRADYVVIAPAALMQGAQALASYRQAKSFTTMVVDVEDIYDEFSYGVVDPHAIQAFLALARSTWKTAPGYAVLAGNGTYDYKDYLRFGDNLLPPLMMATDYGLFASDGQFAPGAGLAIGRLPASNSGEMSALVSKIAAYERGHGDWTKRVVLAADKADPDAGAFPQDSDDLSGLVPAPYIVDKVYLSQLPLQIARAMLLADLNDGAFLLNYLGHGGATQFANSSLLTTGDVASLANGNRMPVVTAFTCLAARFELPGVQCLGKAFVLKSGGGGIAFWGPSALSENNQAKTLAVEFFRQVFGRQEAILGDAVLKASGAEPGMARLYQLLGDPALRLRRPQ